MGRMERGDFYEEDEPVDEIVAAFDAGEPFVTANPTEPRRGWTKFLRLGEGRSTSTVPVRGIRVVTHLT